MDRSLRANLRKSLPKINMSDGIVEQLVEVLQRPRILYKTISEIVNLNDGQLFLTLSESEMKDLEEKGRTNLKQGGIASRKNSINALSEICSDYAKTPHHTVLLDNGMHRPGNLANHPHQNQCVSLALEAYYCLDQQNTPKEEIYDLLWIGVSGYYSIGVLGNCLIREPEANSLELDAIVRIVRCAEGVIFSVCDSEVFAIWCPELN